jgi:hypothetical protein
MGAMTALAREQEGFDYFKAHYTKEGSSNRWFWIPPSEAGPALTLIPEGEGLHEFVSVDYRDRHYAIVDSEGSSPSLQPPWNRDVFRLLEQLSFLATTDPSAFTSQQFITVR